ncbi:MAG TPA: threonine/serine dehydratase, partial [Thermoleophilaceae bacterium]|nr:threonine/serine dehydratase [Thermoleophilaceae bacterium]
MEVAVEAARERLRGVVRETPVLEAGELSRIAGGRVVLKAECLQLTGSFKVRGAHNKLAVLGDGGIGRGVVASSAGNHAQAVSLAATRAGARAVVYMPAGAPLSKVAAVERYGGEVRLVPGAYDDAAAAALEASEAEGLTLVHPFDDLDVIAGQATVGVELAAQVPDLGTVVVPIGGGGLVSGVAVALKERIPGVRVVGVQAEARASGTICDGIAVKRPGELTGRLIAEHVDEIVTVGDDEVAQAMVLLLERSKLVVEGAGAVG